ncbi:ParA family protein [Amycolatopsis arida]|uniref:ParA family protein n=1 Tax=Amycolatopsis arida TaxID=587909 RepID=UPI0010EF4D57|nr:AAA family ATPase [Amycolatopsis arida]TDX84947.1 chromosome partitioning protein [Amycolatopsis arida]
MSARIVAVAMQKGGVGKTTSTINLARAAAVFHRARVLVVDFDPQGNTTSTLAAEDVTPDQLTIADAILGEATIGEVVVPSIWDGIGIDLAPAGETLAVAEGRIAASTAGREHRLRKALEPVLDEYDLVLIDNAPSLGLLLVNALTAAWRAVLVAEADQWSADGLAMLQHTIAGVIEYSNPQLDIAGVLINRWRNTTTAVELAEEITEGVARHFPGVPVWLDRRVPLWQPIVDYIQAGRGLDEGPARLRTLAADTYGPIAGELLGRTAAGVAS